VVCGQCGQVNRIPSDRSAIEANCGKCGSALFDGHPMEIDDAGLTKQIERSDIPVVVDFWAAWCAPCRAMAPAFAEAALALEPNFRFVKIDVDANPGWAAKLGVRGIPTLIVFHNGKVAAQRAGASDASSLIEWVTEAVAAA